MRKISKRNAEMYSEIFGKEAKGKNVEISDKPEVDINQFNKPFALKLTEKIFGALDYLLTAVVPSFIILINIFMNISFTNNEFGFNIFTFVFTKPFLKFIFTIFVYMLSVKLAIWLINFLVNFIIVWVYSLMLNKLVKQTSKLDKSISSKLSEMDKKDKENEERKKYNGVTEKEAINRAEEMIKKRQEEVKQEKDIELIKRDI